MTVKILTKEEFSKKVLRKIMEANCEVMDAIVIMMNEHNLEVEQVPKLLDKPLKEMLESEMLDMNLLKKKEQLPI